MTCRVKYGATCKYHHRYSASGIQGESGMPNDRVSRRFRWVDHSSPNIFGHRPAYRQTVPALDRITRDGEVSSTGIRAFGIDNGARAIKLLYDGYPTLSHENEYHGKSSILQFKFIQFLKVWLKIVSCVRTNTFQLYPELLFVPIASLHYMFFYI